MEVLVMQKHIRAAAIGAGLGLTIWAISFLVITVNSFYGRWYLMGYVYARPSVFFAGIETKEFWELESGSSIYCGTTPNGEYFVVLMDKIFMGDSAKRTCLDP